MPLLLCPNCNVSMQNVARSGVELDMCPSCRGVWLDRGELDKIIERSVQTPTPKSDDHHAHKQRTHGMSNDDYYKKKKRESFLSELFDF